MSIQVNTENNIKSDEDILRMFREENRKDAAFRLLVQRYQERLYWHIRRIVLTHEDADDVLQNTFIKIFRGLNKFKGNAKLFTWMYRIATNESLTFLNKKNKQRTDALDNPDLNLENQLKTDVFFDGDAAQLKLQLAINQLPEKQKLVFNMRYYDEMSYQEISEVLGKSVGGLKASFHHAVKKIENFIRQ